MRLDDLLSAVRRLSRVSAADVQERVNVAVARNVGGEGSVTVTRTQQTERVTGQGATRRGRSAGRTGRTGRAGDR